MGDTGNLFDLLLFAAIAAILVFRLRSVLGRRTGHEPPPVAFGPAETGADNIVPLPERPRKLETVTADQATAEVDAAAVEGVAELCRADPSFAPPEFIVGATMAFEAIVGAYVTGDHKTLKALLNMEILEAFQRGIEHRHAKGLTEEKVIAAIKSARITAAELKSRTAYVTVTFVSEQINCMRDRAGQIVDGDPGRAIEVVDVWTFARTVRSSDPNWILVRTDAAEG